MFFYCAKMTSPPAPPLWGGAGGEVNMVIHLSEARLASSATRGSDKGSPKNSQFLTLSS
jgi:hypothetical protein